MFATPKTIQEFVAACTELTGEQALRMYTTVSVYLQQDIQDLAGHVEQPCEALRYMGRQYRLPTLAALQA